MIEKKDFAEIRTASVGKSSLMYTVFQMEDGNWCVEANWHLKVNNYDKSIKTRTAYDAPPTHEEMVRKLEKKIEKIENSPEEE